MNVDIKLSHVAALLLIWERREFLRNHKKEDRKQRCLEEEESIGEVVGGRAERNGGQGRLFIFRLQ